jgi:undecaprenyl pyrophosphate phosphatase UppP
MDPILIPIVAIVFSLSIPIIAIIVEHFNRKSKMKVIEKAIEKGVTLEGLSLEEKKEPRVPYRSGMITLAAGIGIAIFAIFVGQTEENALYPLLGIASIPALIGIALIINDRINYDRYFKKDLDQPSSSSGMRDNNL